jgi:pSer/pThr/pTyr-binding forkhead associated (FHA) protein
MSVQLKTVGRSETCDYIVLDPKKRVSRKHAEIRWLQKNVFEIFDVNSTNGVYINGKKIPSGKWAVVNPTDKITLSRDYVLHLREVFPEILKRDPDEKTRVLRKEKVSDDRDGDHTVIYQTKGRTYAFDADKTGIGEISQMDDTPFKTIGRDATNDLVLKEPNISRKHCQIRMLNQLMIEIEDLGSTNGTFADGQRLATNKRCQFRSSVSIQLGTHCKLNLKKIFPQLEILPSAKPTAVAGATPQGPDQSMPKGPLTAAERKSFEQLESLWREYQERHSSAANASMSYMIGGSVVGSVLGLALAPFTGGISALASIGGTVVGRYLSMQKTNEIKGDFSYEDAFLQAYACPRCMESFQKKPWITIRECIKCKVKFR